MDHRQNRVCRRRGWLFQRISRSWQIGKNRKVIGKIIKTR